LFSEPTKAWTKLLGTDSYDIGWKISTGNDDSIYISGVTNGNLEGQANQGGMSAFITKYTSDGSTSWTRLVNSNLWHQNDLATDINGAVSFTGSTDRSLDGQANRGNGDAFITKYLSDGTLSWTRLLGSSSAESAKAVVTNTSGEIYISGQAHGNLDGQTNYGPADIFIAKYLSNGTKSWTKLLGSNSGDDALALTLGTDESVYVAGHISGNLNNHTNSGSGDAFIAKYLPDGSEAWTRLIGSPEWERAEALATGIDGSIYVAGITFGNLDGQTNNGGSDAFISKYQGQNRVRLTTYFLKVDLL
jgi:hypothetical protein